MNSPAPKLWQPGLTGGLFIITYLFSTSETAGTIEYEFSKFILQLLPSDRELFTLSSINLAPQSLVILLYSFLLAVFIIKYWRKGTTAISLLVVSIILFGLLMAQVALAIFSQIYLPVGLAALAVILAALPYPMAAWYRRISSNSSNSSNRGKVRCYSLLPWPAKATSPSNPSSGRRGSLGRRRFRRRTV